MVLSGIGLTLLSISLLGFGFSTGTMPSLVPAFGAGDRRDNPLRFWLLAGTHLIWLIAGVVTLSNAL